MIRTSLATIQFRNLFLYLGSRFVSTMAYQMQTVVFGWEVYALRKNPMDLGWLGLAQFLPIIMLAVLTGQLADRRDRKKIILVTHSLWSLGMFFLCFLVRNGHGTLTVYLIVAVIMGVIRAFSNPASQAFVPQLVADENLPRATAWNASVWQTSTIVGPMAGGFLLALVGGSASVYLICAIGAGIGVILMVLVTARPVPPETAPTSWRGLFSGVEYVWKTKKIFGVISLDLFAVLFGGATALLPVFASDILGVGPTGLGLLRSAPGLGAIGMSLYLGLRPITKNAGKKLFFAVAVFGVATICFGISKNFYWSMLFLFVAGAADIISVVIRMTLVQLETPPTMRGRVSAINSVFISASNELGEFESGMTAAWWGVVPAVIVGGVGSMAVAILWSKLFPHILRLDRLVLPQRQN